MTNILKGFLLLFLSSAINFSYGQAKKPTIMVVPSKAWCDANGFTTSYDNQGRTQIVPDYESAYVKNVDLKLVTTKINGMMSDRGFPPKDLETVLSSLNTAAAEEMLTTSKSGSEVSESPVDKIKKVAKADIVMDLTWSINQRGPLKSVTFILQGLDAYTNKPVATATGTGPENGAAPLPVLLETAVLAHMDNFNAKLQNHFDDLFANGREVILKIRKWDSFDGDLEKEYNGKELSEIIESWVAENTVKGRFSVLDATESMMNFEQVRIPLYDDKERATDTRNWARGLQKTLKDKYSIDSKLTMRGLGEASLIIGEK